MEQSIFAHLAHPLQQIHPPRFIGNNLSPFTYSTVSMLVKLICIMGDLFDRSGCFQVKYLFILDSY